MPPVPLFCASAIVIPASAFLGAGGGQFLFEWGVLLRKFAKLPWWPCSLCTRLSTRSSGSSLSFFFILDWGPTSLWILRLGRFVVGRLLSRGPLKFSPLPSLPDPLCRSARLPVSPQVLGHPLVVALLDYLLLHEGVVPALLYLLLQKLLHVSERVDFWALSSSTSLRWRRKLST